MCVKSDAVQIAMIKVEASKAASKAAAEASKAAAEASKAAAEAGKKAVIIGSAAFGAVFLGGVMIVSNTITNVAVINLPGPSGRAQAAQIAEEMAEASGKVAPRGYVDALGSRTRILPSFPGFRWLWSWGSTGKEK